MADAKTPKTANANGQGGNVYKLDRTRSEKVSSTVYTLTLDTPEGIVKIGGKGADYPSSYMHIDNNEKENYRFIGSRMIPLLPEDAGQRGRDHLISEIMTWLDAVEKFDGVTSYIISGGTFASDGKHKDPQTGEIREHKKGEPWPDSRPLNKGFSLLDYKERGKDTRKLTAEELLVQLVRDSFTLRNQAAMQDTLREKAEQTMRAELSIAAPANGKAKKAKEPAVGGIEEDDVEGL